METRRLRREILTFVLASPLARDTVEGIAAWWLLEQRLDRETERVERVLEALVRDGLITKRVGADGRARFSVDPDRLPQIRRLLEQDAP